MVKIEEISKQELRPLVLKSYENDHELFEKYHVGKYNLSECVEKTIEMIDEAATAKELKYYKVICNGSSIGYVVTFDNMLYSFAIKMEYRKKHILIEWWDRLSEILGGSFFAMLYRNNLRAIRFLKRQNMRVILEDLDDNYIVFCNN